MALGVADRVQETSTTTGTGTFDLDGAPSSFQTFVAGIGTTNTCYYVIAHQTLDEWEVGLGTVTDASPDTLSRDTVLASSNADALVSFSAGPKDCFVAQNSTESVLQGSGGRFRILHTNGNAVIEALNSAGLGGEVITRDTNGDTMCRMSFDGSNRGAVDAWDGAGTRRALIHGLGYASFGDVSGNSAAANGDLSAGDGTNGEMDWIGSQARLRLRQQPAIDYGAAADAIYIDNDNTNPAVIRAASALAAGNASLRIISDSSRGTLASRSAIQSGDDLISMFGRGWDGTSAYRNVGLIDIFSIENVTASQSGGGVKFRLAPAGSTTVAEVIRFTGDFNVGLGLTNPGVAATTSGRGTVHLANAAQVPVGALTGGGALLYATSGELRVVDAAGNDTLLSPHDHLTNEWVFQSRQGGRNLRIRMEAFVKAVCNRLGLNFVEETR